MKENRADDMYSHALMNQVFQVSLEQLFKEIPKQQVSLTRIVNQFMDTPFNWLVPNIGNTLRSYIEA
jgi:hypothetical protein